MLLDLTFYQAKEVALLCISQGCRVQNFLASHLGRGWTLYVRLSLTRGQILNELLTNKYIKMSENLMHISKNFT
jgi:hypothetical protein